MLPLYSSLSLCKLQLHQGHQGLIIIIIIWCQTFLFIRWAKIVFFDRCVIARCLILFNIISCYENKKLLSKSFNKLLLFVSDWIGFKFLQKIFSSIDWYLKRKNRKYKSKSSFIWFSIDYLRIGEGELHCMGSREIVNIDYRSSSLSTEVNEVLSMTSELVQETWSWIGTSDSDYCLLETTEK